MFFHGIKNKMGFKDELSWFIDIKKIDITWDSIRNPAESYLLYT